MQPGHLQARRSPTKRLDEVGAKGHSPGTSSELGMITRTRKTKRTQVYLRQGKTVSRPHNVDCSHGIATARGIKIYAAARKGPNTPGIDREKKKRKIDDHRSD